MHINQEHHIEELQKKHIENVFFLNGLKGYETIQEYTIISSDPSDNTGTQLILWVEAVGFDNLTFVAFSPFRVCRDYHPEIMEIDAKELETNKAEDLFILCLANTRNVTQPQITINLTTPIIINYRTGKGKQVTLKNGSLWSSEFDVEN